MVCLRNNNCFERRFLRLSGFQTGALGGFFVGVSLEFQITAFLTATLESLVDRPVRARFDVVDAAADVVIAADLDFDGFITFLFALILDWPFVKRAPEFALDAATAVFRLASGGHGGQLIIVDSAFVENATFVVAIAVVQTFALDDAAEGFGDVFLTAGSCAFEGDFAVIEGVTVVVRFASFSASGHHQFRAIIGLGFAGVNAVFLGDFFAFIHAFSSVQAALIGDFHSFSRRFATVEASAIIDRLADFDFFAVLDATDQIEGACAAFVTGFIDVEILADVDASQLLGDAGFRHQIATSARVD